MLYLKMRFGKVVPRSQLKYTRCCFDLLSQEIDWLRTHCLIPTHSYITWHESFSIFNVCEGPKSAISLIENLSVEGDAADDILVGSVNSDVLLFEQPFLKDSFSDSYYLLVVELDQF